MMCNGLVNVSYNTKLSFYPHSHDTLAHMVVKYERKDHLHILLLCTVMRKFDMTMQ